MITATIFGIAAAGTVGATVVLMGIMAVPIMTKAGYDIRMLGRGPSPPAARSVSWFPPSVMFVVMSGHGVSVAELYASYIGPWFLLAFIFIVYSPGWQLHHPRLGPPLP